MCIILILLAKLNEEFRRRVKRLVCFTALAIIVGLQDWFSYCQNLFTGPSRLSKENAFIIYGQGILTSFFVCVCV